jgi:exonuclease III
MNALSMNIQSLRNKIDDFTVFVQNSKVHFHLIVLSETHLQEQETDKFNLPGYNAVHSVRKNKRFGGVSIYVRHDFASFNTVYQLEFDMNKYPGNTSKKVQFTHCRILQIVTFLAISI